MPMIIYLTDKLGREAKIEGDESVIHAVEIALTNDGWKYHEQSGSWDQGFYSEGHAE